MTKFPHLLAAVEARAKHLNDADGKDLWVIGAAVIKDCEGFRAGASPKPKRAGRPEGAYENAAKELAKRGHDYSAKTLCDMANTVRAFPVNRRHVGVNFFCHGEAKNPDLLDWIVKQVGKDELSGRTVREWVSRWHMLNEVKRREQVEAAEVRKANAKTSGEREEADEELEELGTPMPKGQMPAPSKEDQSALARMTEIFQVDAAASEMLKTLRKNLSILRKLGDDIDVNFIDALVEHHQQVAEVATQISDFLGKSKRGKFSVVKGGVA